MRALLQRVSSASVEVDGQVVGSIDGGLLVLLGCSRGDDAVVAKRMASRISSYRVFEDEQGMTNWDVHQAQGAVLLVSQFTLVADTKKGTRPSFSNALPPDDARQLLEIIANELKGRALRVEQGVFAAKMEVISINTGPASYILDVQSAKL